MKTKITLAIIALLAITHSCADRSDEQEVITEKKETINKKTELKKGASLSNKSVSDSIKNGILSNGGSGIKIETNTPTDSETVDPGSLGTPPTRP